MYSSCVESCAALSMLSDTLHELEAGMWMILRSFVQALTVSSRNRTVGLLTWFEVCQDP